MPIKPYQSTLDTKKRNRESWKDVYGKKVKKKSKRMCQQKGCNDSAAPNWYYCPHHHKMKG